MIIITSGKETTLGKMADEFLYAPRPSTIGEVETDKLSIPTFFTATKYLLDLRLHVRLGALLPLLLRPQRRDDRRRMHARAVLLL